MELIGHIFTTALAAVASFIGHLLAHDFAAITPSFARALIRKAARTLPKAERARYREEWLAHLNECDGVIPKFKHVAGCVLCARRMRAEATRQQWSVRLKFEVCGVGTVETNFATLLFASDIAKYKMKNRKSFWLRWRDKPSVAALFLLKFSYQYPLYGEPDVQKAFRILDWVDKSPEKQSPRFKAWINGKLVDFDEQQSKMARRRKRATT